MLLIKDGLIINRMNSLTNRKKVVSDKPMTFTEKMYLWAIAKGMMVTLKHMLRRRKTIKYPEETRVFAPVYRGMHVLKRDEEGRENCTACGLCAVACPAEAITMVAAEREKGEEKLYREENKETIIEKRKLYYEENKEVLNERQRLIYDPLKRKQRYERNKSHILNRCRQYYLKNKENIKFKHFTYRLTNKHKSAIYLLNRRYGIGAEEYEKMKLRQENRCAICSTHAKDTKRKILYVDHDHKTGYVRSLLCHDCNSGIGFLKDSEDLFMKAIEYIRKFKSTLDG